MFLKKLIKIRLLSDLHLELQLEPVLNFKMPADIVILAGDIGNPFQDSYVNLLRKLSLVHSKVIVITGNHEYYSDKPMSEIDDKIRDICSADEDISFLQKESVIYDRIKFIGCTLWSHPTDPTLCKYMNDFKQISRTDHSFNFDYYVGTHLLHKKWIESELSMGKSDAYDKICAITHHLPSYELIDPAYESDPLNSFFASDMNTVGADVWCYGHTHTANHTEIDQTQFHCNPRGYANDKSGWDIDCVFEI